MTKIDMRKLAEIMLEYEDHQRKEEIEKAVLGLGKSQVVGNVKATYYNGRKRYDYKDDNVDPELVEQFTEPKTDWRKLVLEGLGVPKDDIPYSQSDPSVSVRIES